MCNFPKLANMAPYSIYCRDTEPTTRPDIDLANNKPWSAKSMSLAQELAKFGDSKGPGTESAHVFCNYLTTALERNPKLLEHVGKEIQAGARAVIQKLKRSL